MKTVLLYAAYTDKMSYFDDWLDAFRSHNDFDSLLVNVNSQHIDLLSLHKQIENADVVVLHHSMNGDTLKYLKPFISVLKSRKGKLVSFVGNEVNLPGIGMSDKISVLKDLETDIIATQLLREAGEWLYSSCEKTNIISLPHALNHKEFYPSRLVQQRNIDIGTRSAHYGVYIGDNDRNRIISYFNDHASMHNLNVDLGLNNSVQQRFNRVDWSKFLNSCKATLSTEAGSFYLERDDLLVAKIQKYLQHNSSKFVLPKSDFLRSLYRNIVPEFVRKAVVNLLDNKIIEADNVDENVDFEMIYNKFFVGQQRCPVYSKAISSRHFDAIGTKTLHIMYPGRYNDILTPGEHFFELKFDHSNLDDLLQLLNDTDRIQEITNRVYEYVIEKHTHKNRLDTLSSSIKNLS